MDRGPHCTGRHAPLSRQPRLGGVQRWTRIRGIWGSDMDALGERHHTFVSCPSTEQRCTAGRVDHLNMT
jgi:hypothetical protein